MIDQPSSGGGERSDQSRRAIRQLRSLDFIRKFREHGSENGRR